MIPYGRQDITHEDIEAVQQVLQSDFLTQGPAVPEFERVLATYCQVPHAVVVNSATSALHVACLALGVGPGDRVWTSPITFVASSNCALYCGASVDFVDIDPATFNMCSLQLESKLKRARAEGKLPKVVIPVHMAGQSCDMAAIAALAVEYGFRIIEDASHAIGGSYQGAPVGVCTYSDITIFSFHPVKIVTTAEGGAALTRDAGLAAKMGLLRSHGITRDPAAMVGKSEGGWYYEQVDLGFNYRMTDLQAALGCSQMTRLDTYVAKRHEIADRYDALLAEFPVILPVRKPEAHSALHLYIIQVGEGQDRATVFAELRKLGVGVNVHYIPVYLQPYYRKLGFAQGYCPNAEAYYARCISLPMYPGLSEADQLAVVAALKQSLS